MQYANSFRLAAFRAGAVTLGISGLLLSSPNDAVAASRDPGEGPAKASLQPLPVPAITCPPDVEGVSCDRVGTNFTGVATAFSFCANAPIAASYSDALGATFGTILRTWTAVDICGSNSCVQTISYQSVFPTVQREALVGQIVIQISVVPSFPVLSWVIGSVPVTGFPPGVFPVPGRNDSIIVDFSVFEGGQFLNLGANLQANLDSLCDPVAFNFTSVGDVPVVTLSRGVTQGHTVGGTTPGDEVAVTPCGKLWDNSQYFKFQAPSSGVAAIHAQQPPADALAAAFTQLYPVNPIACTNRSAAGTMDFSFAVAKDSVYFLGVNASQNLEMEVTVTPSVDLVWSNPPDITYGTPLGSAQLSAVASSGGVAIPGKFAYSPPAGTVLHAGGGQTLSVVFTPDDTATYTSGSAHVTLNVKPATLTISAQDATKSYGEALPNLSLVQSGFVNGETSLNPPATATTTAGVASPPGTYPISVNGAVSQDYSITVHQATLTIVPAPLKIRALDASKVYGEAVPSLSLSYDGFVLGDTPATSLNPAPVATTQALNNSPVGAYPIAVFGGASVNYQLIRTDGTLTISAAPLAILADDKTKAAGDPLPVLTWSLGGLVAGDTVASFAHPPTLSTPATVDSPPGSYPIFISGAVDPNYDITYIDGTLTVTPAQFQALKLSPNDLTIAPDGTVTLTLAVARGADVRLDASDDPAHWSTLETRTAGTNGQVSFTIAPVNNLSHRFFRVALLR